MEFIRAAIGAVEGKQKTVAKSCSKLSGENIKQQHISYWLTHMDKWPAEQVLGLEACTQLSRYDIRPDIFGAPPAA